MGIWDGKEEVIWRRIRGKAEEGVQGLNVLVSRKY
jgi:hypothetical protein